MISSHLSKPLVILGSARTDGNTRRALQHLFPEESSFQLLDLCKYDLSHYSYDHEEVDNFLNIVHKIMDHQDILFATPVYWYAMSGRLKVFFDRLTALSSSHKNIGRQLVGKRMFLLATGTDPDLPPGFEIPFSKTAAYFAMLYSGGIYYVFKDDDILKEPNHLEDFRRRLISSYNSTYQT